VKHAEGRVSAIERAPGRKSAVDIYVDDSFWRRTNARAGRDAGIAVGVQLNPAVIRTLDAAERAAAREMSLRLLGYRARSVSEIRTKLTASGLGPEAVEDQIARLSDAGYLDDAEFARSWIDDRIRVRHYGRDRIASELAAFGVDPSVFSSLLDEVCTEEQELTRAAWLLETKRHRGAGRDSVAGLHRAYQWLLRRGFSAGVARRAVNRCEESPERPRTGHSC
jgi:regulatory protein